MLTAFIRAFRTPDLRKKLLFTLAMLAVFRFGAAVPTPGISEKAVKVCTGLESKSSAAGVYQLVNLFSGGALLKLSVFALGIMPYITASIILQLLAVVIPRLETLRQEGQAGQQKITQYTRYLTVGLAVLQSTGIIALARSGNLFGTSCPSLIPNSSVFTITTMVICMTAGTAVIMWLGELITDRGVGNGMSVLIFTTVISQMVGYMVDVYRAKTIFVLVVVLAVGVAIVAFVVFMEQAQRRIPVQYAKRMVGRKMYGGTSTYIPLKVNQAGVIPVIFASSLLYIPILAASLFGNKTAPLALGQLHQQQPGQRGERGLGPLHDPVLRAHRLLHLLLRVDHVQPGRSRGQHEEVRRVHPRHPSRAADRAVPQLRAHQAHRTGVAVPGPHRAAAHGGLRAARRGYPVPVRRDEHPDRGRGGAGHGEADRKPVAAAQLRGLPEVVRVVLVGPPGAGKGTQAQFIASHLSIPKISTGDIFRTNVSQGTALGRRAQAFMGRGDLVPDEVTIAMVTDRLQEDDAQSGFLLDGFPRTVPQAETLKKMLASWDTKLDVVLELVVDDDEVVRRLSGRRTCRRCGRVWHALFDPPARKDRCDDCGAELFQRDDDREETIRHRIEVYQEQTAPLVAFYADEGILLGIDATGPVEEITERALSALRRFIR